MRWFRVFIVVILALILFIQFRIIDPASVLGTNTINTSLTVSNNAPTFASDGAPYEVPISYSGTPINVGASISFYAKGEDQELDEYYLAVCKTNSITPGSNAAPTCPGGNWCITSTSTVSGTVANCSYTTLQGDSEGPNDWYAFVCDKISGTGMCSTAQQGTGNSGSPFYINHKPTFSQITDDGGTGVNSSADPSGTMTFTAIASDSDIDNAADTVKLVVCADTSGATSAGCTGVQLCTSVFVANNPTCSYSIPSVKDNGNYNYYAYIFDSHLVGSASNYLTGQYAVADVAPQVSSVTVNGGSPINLIENTTTDINVTATVSDANSCVDISSVTASLYRSPAYDFASCDNQITEENANHCYAEVTCTVAAGSCTGNTDSTANYTCLVAMQFHADPTTGDGTDPTDPTWWSNNWKSTVKATSNLTTHSFESLTGVEVEKTLGINLTSSLSYGNMSRGANTGVTLSTDVNKVTPVEATGNVGMDIGFSGTDMCTTFTPPNTCSGNIISVSNQKYFYSGTQFDYNVAGTVLTGTATEEEVNVPKTIVTNLKANKLILWGILTPANAAVGTYHGQNTLTAYIGESANW